MTFPDTGPQPDGSRTAEQWMNAMGEDVNLVNYHLKNSMREDVDEQEIALHVALARKEANRLLSDIRRFADEVHGLTAQDLDDVGPL